MGIVDGKTICQVALVVKNIEETAKAYAELFGVDVPDVFTVPPESEAHTKFKGQPTNTRAKLAVFDLGQVVLEITEPDSILKRTGCRSATMANIQAATIQYLTVKKNSVPLSR